MLIFQREGGTNWVVSRLQVDPLVAMAKAGEDLVADRACRRSDLIDPDFPADQSHEITTPDRVNGEGRDVDRH